MASRVCAECQNTGLVELWSTTRVCSQGCQSDWPRRDWMPVETYTDDRPVSGSEISLPVYDVCKLPPGYDDVNRHEKL